MYNLNRQKYADSRVREWVYWQQSAFDAAQVGNFGRWGCLYLCIWCLTMVPDHGARSVPLVNIVANGPGALNNPQLSSLSSNSTTVTLDTNHLVMFKPSGAQVVIDQTLSLLP